jgi:ATP-dependent DNA helicase RecG
MVTVDPGEELPARVAGWIGGGETYEIEFKGEQRAALSDRDLVEAVVCLANGSGGVLLVGVEDDGTVTGARPRHEAGATDTLRAQASGCALRPRPPDADTPPAPASPSSPGCRPPR